MEHIGGGGEHVDLRSLNKFGALLKRREGTFGGAKYSLVACRVRYTGGTPDCTPSQILCARLHMKNSFSTMLALHVSYRFGVPSPRPPGNRAGEALPVVRSVTGDRLWLDRFNQYVLTKIHQCSAQL